MCSPDLFLGLLAVLFPPVAVWIKVGVCSADSLINIALCCLGYVPGLLHAWYIILKHPEPDDEYPDGYQPIVGSGSGHDAEGGRVTYYYVAHHHQDGHSPHPSSQRSYGATQQHPPQGPHASTKPAPPAPSNKPPQKKNGSGQAEGEQEGSSSRPHDETRAPPTYAEAVKGDHKIQD